MPHKPFVLAADMGGTNARFALYAVEADTGPRLRGSLWLRTRDYRDFREMVDALAASVLAPDLAGVGSVVFAVAGAVRHPRRVKGPNIDYPVDLSELTRLTGHCPMTLVNDFVAQAYGCLAAREAVEVLPGRFEPRDVQTVVGAGTGLGMAIVTPDPSGGLPRVWPTEGGHAAIAAENPDELDFFRFTAARFGEPYARRESVLSGAGLALLHEYLLGECVEPVQAGAALREDSPVTRWFAAFYGRACRDFVFQCLGLGGVHVSGGVAIRNQMLVRHEAFGAAFRGAASHRDLLAGVPVRLVADEDAGLKGAALLGARLSQEDCPP